MLENVGISLQKTKKSEYSSARTQPAKRDIENSWCFVVKHVLKMSYFEDFCNKSVSLVRGLFNEREENRQDTESKFIE